MNGRVAGKVAVVTGGAKGIGSATCERLAGAGASVAVTDLDDEQGQAVVARIEQAGCSARYWHLDVTDEAAVEQTFREVRQVFGPIDVLVNNAGIAGVNKPTDEISLEEWNAVMDVNVRGVFLCSKHVIPYMREAGGGSIINLSSIYGIISAADLPPYHASKGAIRLMSKTDALYYAREGIRVNSVHPGYIWTPLVEQLANEAPEGAAAFRAALAAKHPIGHVGEPDDIAYAVLYLASDEAKFVTGSELLVDGGYTAQ